MKPVCLSVLLSLLGLEGIADGCGPNNRSERIFGNSQVGFPFKKAFYRKTKDIPIASTCGRVF